MTGRVAVSTAEQQPAVPTGVAHAATPVSSAGAGPDVEEVEEVEAVEEGLRRRAARDH